MSKVVIRSVEHGKYGRHIPIIEIDGVAWKASLSCIDADDARAEAVKALKAIAGHVERTDEHD